MKKFSLQNLYHFSISKRNDKLYSNLLHAYMPELFPTTLVVSDKTESKTHSSYTPRHTSNILTPTSNEEEQVEAKYD